jgi:hypothetical protein
MDLASVAREWTHGRVWRHEIKGSRVEVRIEPFVKIPKWARSGTAEEAERLAEFFGGTLSLKLPSS